MIYLIRIRSAGATLAPKGYNRNWDSPNYNTNNNNSNDKQLETDGESEEGGREVNGRRINLTGAMTKRDPPPKTPDGEKHDEDVEDEEEDDDDNDSVKDAASSNKPPVSGQDGFRAVEMAEATREYGIEIECSVYQFRESTRSCQARRPKKSKETSLPFSPQLNRLLVTWESDFRQLRPRRWSQSASSAMRKRRMMMMTTKMLGAFAWPSFQYGRLSLLHFSSF